MRPQFTEMHRGHCLRLLPLGICWILIVFTNQYEYHDTIISLLGGKETRKRNALSSILPLTPPPNHLFWEALTSLTKALQEDPVRLGSGSWTWTNINTNFSDTTKNNNTQSDLFSWTFDGIHSELIKEAFHGKRIAMVGDSTLFYLHRWLQTLAMDGGMSDTSLDQLEGIPMHAANNVVRTTVEAHEKVVPRPSMQDAVNNIPPSKSKETVIVWDGYRGISGERACHWELDTFWDRTRQFRPDILVVNFGLHWLHLQGGGRDVPLCYAEWWLNYEDWLERAYQVAHESNIPLILFKTTNYFCESKFNGQYSDTIAKFKVDREQLQQLYPSASLMDTDQNNILNNNYQNTPAFNLCATQLEHIRNLNATLAMAQILSAHNIYRYCSEGTFDEEGVRKLNARLLDFVKQKQKEQNNGSTLTAAAPSTVAIFNDHDLESCRFTLDGRHYDPLLLVRIRVLANMVQALYGRK